jgi:hypothetical protein
MEIDKTDETSSLEGVPVPAGVEEGNDMVEDGLPQAVPAAPLPSSSAPAASSPHAEAFSSPPAEAQPPAKRKLHIYAAGKMMFFNCPTRDWRGLARYKELEWGDQGEPLLEKLKELRELELDFDDNWIYVGPHFLTCPGIDHEVDYFYQLDDEPRSGAALASVLGDESQRDFTVDEREKQALYDNARHQIEKCDVLYARLTDEKDCFWAFTEIGLAAALGTLGNLLTFFSRWCVSLTLYR